MNPMAYTLSFIFPVLTFSSLYVGGWSLLMVPVFTFVLVPVLELFYKGVTDNYTEDAEKERAQNPIFDWLLYSIVPIQVGLVSALVYSCAVGHIQGWEIIGAVLSVGICCGAFGINVAHELGHRTKKHEVFLAKILLLTSLYMHFYIEHNRGHHAKVATPEDPASSFKNQTLFAFWLRSVPLSWISAWKIENRRLRKHGNPTFRLDNQMFRFQIIQAATIAFVFLTAGLVPCLAFIGAAICGFLLLETVNYVEHYGLSRNKNAKGRYERVRPHHSWNSNHSIGRLLLFELTRHSDHHAHASRKYSVLRHFDHSPQLPTGYPGMIVLALFPPLFFRVMNPCLERELARMDEAAA